MFYFFNCICICFINAEGKANVLTKPLILEARLGKHDTLNYILGNQKHSLSGTPEILNKTQ